METIKREQYLSKIRPFINQTELVKVAVGIRRSGKSVMLELIQKELLENGVEKNQIISINFEDMSYNSIKTAETLHKYLKEKIDSVKKRVYLFLDEIQEVSEWEKCINSLRVNSDVDIYLTGSNALMLSGEYATLLSGRYTEITVYPFSFSEYCDAVRLRHPEKDIEMLFREYINVGGFPFLSNIDLDGHSAKQYLRDIYSSVVIKDITKRFAIRDIDLLERIIGYVFANIGRTFSASSISKYFKSEHRNASVDTVINYINACNRSFLIYKIPKIDLKGKDILKISEKYYIADHGLRQAMYGNNQRDIELIAENIVCTELLRRGYDVFVGQIGDREIDFVCEKDGKRVYFQVCYLLASEETVAREFGVYEKIRDNYPKYVLSFDEFDMSRDGIIHKNITDFLLNGI